MNTTPTPHAIMSSCLGKRKQQSQASKDQTAHKLRRSDAEAEFRGLRHDANSLYIALSRLNRGGCKAWFSPRLQLVLTHADVTEMNECTACGVSQKLPSRVDLCCLESFVGEGRANFTINLDGVPPPRRPYARMADQFASSVAILSTNPTIMSTDEGARLIMLVMSICHKASLARQILSFLTFRVSGPTARSRNEYADVQSHIKYYTPA